MAIILRVPPSSDAGAFCLGLGEKRPCDGKPVIRAPPIPREPKLSLTRSTLSEEESHIKRRGYAIVAHRS
jgi:hypothetical protein